MIGVAYGYGTAPVNPFTIGLAQSIAGLPSLLRHVVPLDHVTAGTVVAVVFLLRYCRKIKADPSKSIVSDIDYSDFKLEEVGDCKISKRQITGVLTAFFGGILLLMVMIVLKGWYMTELSAFFSVWPSYAA